MNIRFVRRRSRFTLLLAAVAPAGPTTTLFFAAGPDDETHGLFGSITAQE
jgi:hypothetical protein